MPPPWIAYTTGAVPGAASALDDGEVDRVAEVSRHADAAPFEPAALETGVEFGLGDVELAHPGQGLGVTVKGPRAANASRNGTSSGSNGGWTRRSMARGRWHGALLR